MLVLLEMCIHKLQTIRFVKVSVHSPPGEPRFDVNVTVPAYVMDDEKAVVRGVVMAK